MPTVQHRIIMMTAYPSYFIPGLVSSLVAFVLYINTLDADFVYDDSRAILTTDDLRPTTAWSNLLSNDFWGVPLNYSGSHKSFRPLTVATFRLNYMLAQLRPYQYHLTNVILHSVTTFFICILSDYLSTRSGGTVTWLSGLLFACHSIHTEAVASIVGRADILCTLLSLWCILCYIRFRATNGRKVVNFILTISLAFLAMLCKEHGATMLGVCLIYDLIFLVNKDSNEKCNSENFIRRLSMKIRNRDIWLPWTCIGISTCLFLLFRLWVMDFSKPEFSQADNPASHSSDIFTRCLTFLYLPVFNFYLLLCPVTLSFDWSMDSIPLVTSLADNRNIVPFIFYIGLIILACKFLFSQRPPRHAGHVQTNNHVTSDNSHQPIRKDHFDINGNACFQCENNDFCQNSVFMETMATVDQKFVTSFAAVVPYDDDLKAFSIAWMVISFLPATNLLFYVGFVVAERVLYLPSVGYCILFAYSIDSILKSYLRDMPRVMKILFKFLIFVFLSTLAIKTMLRNRDWSNEELLYKSGVKINPAKAYSNLGNIWAQQKKFNQAKFAYLAALKHRPSMADTHYNYGILLQDHGQYDEALKAYERAISCRPRLAAAHLNLGIILTKLARFREAEQRYLICSELNGEGLKDPRTHQHAKISCLFNLGRLKFDQQRYEEAIVIYYRAMEIRITSYQFHSLYNMLGEAHMKLNQMDSAERWYQASLLAKPDHVPAMLTYGYLLQTRKNYAQALALFEKAIQLEPSNILVLQYLAQYWFDRKNYAKSAEIYEKAFQVDSNNFDVVFALANVHRHMNKNGEAEKFYAKTVNIRPDSSMAHLNYGACLHVNKKYKEAEKAYVRALELKRGDKTALENLKKLKNLMQTKL